MDDVDSRIIQLENTDRASSAANTNKTTLTVFTNESYERSDYSSFKDDLEARFLNENLTYPEHFPNYSKDFGGVKLDAELFSRLLPGKWIDGEIINSFFIALQDIAHKNNLNLLTFDSYFSQKLMTRQKSTGFENWAKRVQPSQFDIWLLPVLLRESHWILLVIGSSQRVMVYFDSCHGLPPEILNHRVCSFIATFRTARSAKFTQWKKWTISALD